ncbi:hypothetical protein P154DRAFT_63908 [Amniculicola lignicola CBS 123094]|uniref:BTB domain-containing protein n=1 Tax=Amniculicola lignicola CBS 123094 TaxID=1392246 RepID=A0A6A5WQJ3_9PLEO|nr:hypothetical protein P154DRAFT_63908 [Amniculicola lignicola CBS 123094]
MATNPANDATSISEVTRAAASLQLAAGPDEVTANTPDRTVDGDTTVIAERGDLDFVVSSRHGNHSQQFLVYSRCVRIASALWAKQLNATTPATFDRTRQIHIFEDRVDLVILILNACHLFHDRIPSSLSFDDLSALAVLCGVHAIVICNLHPFINSWVHPWRPMIGVTGYHMWLAIAYEFGLRQIFASASEAIALNMRISDGGSLITPEGVRLFSEDISKTTVGMCLTQSANLLLILSCLEGHLLQIRASTLVDIVECYDKHIAYLEESIRTWQPNTTCRKIALVYLTQGLQKLKWNKIQQHTKTVRIAKEVKLSVSDLLASLLAINVPDCTCPHNGEATHENFSVPPLRLHDKDFVYRNSMVDGHFTEKEAILGRPTSSGPSITKARWGNIGKFRRPTKPAPMPPLVETPVWQHWAATQWQMQDKDWAEEDMEDEEDEEYRYRAPAPGEEPDEEYCEDEE